MREAEPSSPTPAERAFFRWQYAIGSYEYARRHGSPAATEALARQVAERYDTYATLRDGQDGPGSCAADQLWSAETNATAPLLAEPHTGQEAGKPDAP